MLKAKRRLSLILAFVCLYFILADYSVYYIKYSNSIVVLIGILSVLFYNSIANVLTFKYFIYSFIFAGGWLVVFLLSTFLNDCPVHPAFYIQVLFGMFIISLTDDIRHNTFKYFVNLYTIVLLFSLIDYIFFMIGVSYSLGIVYRGENHHIPFIHTLFNLIRLSAPRFQSLTEEPGVVGTINAFIIYLLQSKKCYKQKIILYITGFFTFSMAFYIITLIFLLLEKIALKKILVTLIASFTLFAIFPKTSEKMILDRITERRVDNRTHDNFKNMYVQAQKNGELIIGKGHQSFNRYLTQWDGSAGALVFIYQYGIIGLTIIFICYSWAFFRMSSTNRFCFVFYLVFWLSFYQRQFIYQPFYILILYSCYCEYEYFKKEGTYITIT